MIWTDQDVLEFLKRVAPPDEELQGFDDRLLYMDAIAFAESLGDDGSKLLEALVALK